MLLDSFKWLLQCFYSIFWAFWVSWNYIILRDISPLSFVLFLISFSPVIIVCFARKPERSSFIYFITLLLIFISRKNRSTFLCFPEQNLRTAFSATITRLYKTIFLFHVKLKLPLALFLFDGNYRRTNIGQWNIVFNKRYDPTQISTHPVILHQARKSTSSQ